MRLHFWRQAALVVAATSVVVQAFRPAVGAISVVAQAYTAAAPAAQQPPARQSVWDGVFTDDQARRGEVHYARSCESCHGADLSGNPVDEIPALAWDAFLLHWSGKTIKELYDTIKQSMPQDKPGSLNARAYADVIAYLLQVNKFPSGARELGLNPDVLANIVIERTKRE